VKDDVKYTKIEGEEMDLVLQCLQTCYKSWDSWIAADTLPKGVDEQGARIIQDKIAAIGYKLELMFKRKNKEEKKKSHLKLMK